MANEATVTVNLQIKAGNIDYTSQPNVWRADVTGRKGPSPGAINVSRTGTTVSFSELTDPALCRFLNLDTTFYCEVGIWNPQNLEFYPMLILRPGRSIIVELSPSLREEFSSPGTGTGTAAAGAVELRLKAEWASGTTGVNVLIEAFER